MQENRSFDHYFGTLRGVRGFGDRSTITAARRAVGLRAADDAARPAGHDDPVPVAAERGAVPAYPAGHQPPSAETRRAGLRRHGHSWDDQHGAWYGGLMNGW